MVASKATMDLFCASKGKTIALSVKIGPGKREKQLDVQKWGIEVFKFVVRINNSNPMSLHYHNVISSSDELVDYFVRGILWHS